VSGLIVIYSNYSCGVRVVLITKDFIHQQIKIEMSTNNCEKGPVIILINKHCICYCIC